MCFPFVGDSVGGSHVSAIKLVQALDPTRVRALVTLHIDGGRLADFLRAEGVDYVVAPDVAMPEAGHQVTWSKLSVPHLWYHVSQRTPRLARFLKEHEVDIVHTNDGRIHSLWSAAIRLAGAKQLWHHRADPRSTGVNYLAPILAHHIVTVSNFARPNRPVLPIGHKWTVVHSPFDHPQEVPDRQQAKQALLSELGCDSETRTLGYFGALIERKRPVAFVEAVHAFIERHPDIPVAGLIFGREPEEGPPLEEAVRRRAAELSISDHIHLMGFRYPVEPLMGGTDILLVPAVNEPFGRTLIEAMLLGTPVVATNHGGNPEAIEDGVNGFLVDVDKPQAFVEPIRRLLCDDACWQRVAETARSQALTAYGLDKHVSAITDIYHRLVPASGNRADPARANRFPA